MRVEPDRLRAYGMSPEEVVKAIAAGNAITPAGNVRIGDYNRIAPINSVVSNIQELAAPPVRLGSGPTVYVRDVGTVENGSDILTGYGLVNGRRTVYIPVTKRSDASTLEVVNRVKSELPRWAVFGVYLLTAGSVIFLIGRHLGNDIFPNVDTGMFQLRLRAPAGTRVERTEVIAQKALDVIRSEAGADNVAITLGYVGTQPASFPVNTIHLWTSGPQEAALLISLRSGSGVRVEEFKERLRRNLPEAIPDTALSFEAGDVVSQVMNFGAPTPIEIAVSGPSLAANRAFADKVMAEMKKVGSLRDLQFSQPLDYLTVSINIDRERAGQLGVTVEQIGRSLAAEEVTYQRLKSASATPGAVAGNDVEVALRSVEASRARAQLWGENEKAAQAQLKALEENERALGEAARTSQNIEAYLRITAPFDGVITERNAHPGSLAGTGGQSAAPLLRLQQVSRLRLVVAVPESEVAGVASGAKVNFTVPAAPGEQFTGMVRRISHALDAKTRTMPVELDVNNSAGRLAPGMFPEVIWPARRLRPSLFVPPTAVATTTERTFVIRVREGQA